ncbi:Uncharacterized protein ACMD2_24358 [Ananas comosus]|uniref:Lactation elevated protein 1 n=1 Tax=Ananas comosus TaxID=4615 RepID=A0A199UXL1_ANACO|nr:Uncharacterized protein ACMD2_24358 [Ananas comosus]
MLKLEQQTKVASLEHATIWRLVYDSPHCRLCNSRQQVVKAVELGMGSIHGPAARGLIRAHETVTFHALLAAEAVESFRYGLKIKPPRPSGKACDAARLAFAAEEEQGEEEEPTAAGSSVREREEGRPSGFAMEVWTLERRKTGKDLEELDGTATGPLMLSISIKRRDRPLPAVPTPERLRGLRIERSLPPSAGNADQPSYYRRPTIFFVVLLARINCRCGNESIIRPLPAGSLPQEPRRSRIPVAPFHDRRSSMSLLPPIPELFRSPAGIPMKSDSSSNEMPGPLAIYRRMVREGKLQQDMYQEKVASELEDLLGRLEQYEKEMEGYHEKLVIWEKNRESERRKLLLEEAEIKQQDGVWIENKKRSGFLNKLISRRRRADVEPGVGKMVSYLNREKKLDTVVGQRPAAPLAPKGIYLYGNVGSEFSNESKGHSLNIKQGKAMLEIHEHMHDIWKNQAEEKSLQSSAFSWIAGLSFDTKVKEWLVGEEKYKKEVQTKHILPAVADKFLIDRRADKSGASILCFDEIQTVDVFAIVALSGIMSRLLSTGTVLVATSNRAPEDLNQDGMQREIFLEFLSTLEENCQKFFVGSKTDYRRLIPTNNVDQVWAHNARFPAAL